MLRCIAQLPRVLVEWSAVRLGEKRQATHARPKKTRWVLGTFALLAILPIGLVAKAPNVLAEGTVTSAAEAQWLQVGLLPLNVAGLAYTNTQFVPGGPNAAEWDSLNVSLLNALEVNLGSITIPLVKDPGNPAAQGLLELGNLGLLKSYSNSPSANWSNAATGLLTDNGALDVSAYSNPGLTNSKLDLTALLGQVLGEPSQALFTKAAIEVGAVGSQVTAGNLNQAAEEDCVFNVNRDYVLTDLKLDTVSPLITGAVTAINDPTTGLLATTVVSPLNALVGEGGGVTTLVNGVLAPIEAVLNAIDLGLVETRGTASVNSITLDTAPLIASVQQVLAQPLTNADGSIRIDLQSGQILVDLGKYAVEKANSGKPESEWVDLSSLPANTEVLDAATITAILNGVTDLLNGDPATHPDSLSAKLIQTVNTGVYNTNLNISLQIKVESCVLDVCMTVVDAPATVQGTLGGYMGQTGYAAPVIDVSQLTIAGVPAGALATPIEVILQGLVTSIGSLLTTTIADPNTGILANFQQGLVGTNGVITNLLTNLVGTSGALRTLLDNLATITINRQPAVGDLGAGSYTVRALEVVLLPNVGVNGAVPVEFASSTALAGAPVCVTLQKTIVQASQFTWAKQALVGDWVLQASSLNQTATGVTGDATITRVPLPGGSYTLSESVGLLGITGGLSWDSYRNTWACVDETSTPIAVVNTEVIGAYTTGTVALEPNPDPTSPSYVVAEATCTVTNTLTTATASWLKTDAGTPANPLTGSLWKIERTSAPEVTILVADANSAIEPGAFQVTGLPVGSYRLVETQSPAGYVLRTDPILFTVNADGTITGLTANQPLVNQQVTVPAIPLTGKLSAELFYVGGGGAILIALVTVAFARRRSHAQQDS